MNRLEKLMELYLSNIKGFHLKTCIITMTDGIVKKSVSILENNLNECLEAWSNEKIVETLYTLDDHYYNGKSLVSDKTYDKIVDYYKEIRGKTYDKIGAPIKGEKVKLPLHMGSMDKVKPGSSQLKNYFVKYTNPKCVMDKLDGTSLLLDMREIGNPKAYTRGNGTYGQDITRKIRFIKGMNNTRKWKNGGFIRGELIVPKKHWEDISDQGANARNFVSGLINKKLTVPDELKNITFVAYEWYSEPSSEYKLSISKQLDSLKENGFETVKYKVFSSLTEEELPDILTNYRHVSPYEIDGIIIQDDVFHERNVSKNPKYAKAFKMDTMCDSAITTIKEIKWDASKDGSLRPIAVFKEVSLSGVNISRASAYNAAYVKDNKLGTGAKVKIIRSGEVIPKIVDVISCDTPDFPECEYVWDSNNTHIFLKNSDDSDVVKIKQILYFCRTMDISFLKEGLIKKAYERGCDSILKILTLNSDSIMKYDIEGVKDKTAAKIVKSIQTRLSQSTLGDISAATPYFNSMAKKRMNIIDSSIENWLNIPESELLSEIENLSGFSRKTADVVVAGRNDFKKFYTELNKHNIVISKKNSKQDEVTIDTKSNIHMSKIFLFTGFRDEKLKNTILENGGNVKDTLSKKITHLVIPEDGFTNSKVERALSMGINVILKTDSMFH